MKVLMLKTLVAMCLLFCALLYGMNMVKDHLVQMNGKKASETKTSVLDFTIPKLSPGDPKSKESAMKSTHVEKTVDGTKAGKPRNKKMATYVSIEERIDRLNAIDTFNPFATLGDKVGKGVSVVFSRGMEATSTLLGGLVKSVL